ncbi:hypothetical protein AWR27_19970 [Spirosoma montaniterrae]|uniref:Glycosyltransferase 2-like domain-containing protein n=1 Tax=Spirosoma montaniterrae TaxID=1178516 RepID=A0A1P9X196_9BACT|nr:hypothetical protein AWR27_19970 [Spirosoma montaniterrae]
MLTQKGIRSLYDALSYHQNHVLDSAYRFAVVVVDDGSTDGSSEWISRHYPDIHLIKGDGNLWWSGAVNLGAKHAVEHLQADFVILWNDDTLCEIDYFVELDAVLKKEPAYSRSILVSKIYWLGESNKLFNYGCYYSHKTGQKKLIGANETDRGQFNDIIRIDWSGGMGTVIPATVLTKVGFFDADIFPQYHGDMDFFLRAGKLGVASFAVPTLKIYNNRESTGLTKARSFDDLRKMLVSNRSLHNIRHNIVLNKRHANTVFGWANLTLSYAKLIIKSLRTIVWA